MRRILVLVTFLLATTGAWAAAGPREAPAVQRARGRVVELTGDRIVVVSGKQRWEIERNERTKVFGDLQVGALVTVEYRVLPPPARAK